MRRFLHVLLQVCCAAGGLAVKETERGARVASGSPSGTSKTRADDKTLIIVVVIAVAAVVLIGVVGAAWLFSLSGSEQEFSDRIEIPSDGFHSFSFNVTRDIEEIYYWVTNESGPPVDIMFLTPADYGRYLTRLPPQDPFSLVHEQAWGMPNSPYLNKGQYWFVLDNSDFGSLRPGGQSTVVRYELRI